MHLTSIARLMKKLCLFIAFFLYTTQIVYAQDCISIDQSTLAKSINDYRQKNGKNLLNLSYTLCYSATQKATSLQENGQQIYLSSELYNNNEKMINMKVRGIDANSQNTIATFTMRHPELDPWKVILEEDAFAGKNWISFGVGFYKNYAVIWFSDKELNDVPPVCGGQTLNTQTEIIIVRKKELPAIKDGKWLVEPTYYKMGFGPTDNGLYPVADDTEKWGYINLKGEVEISFQFERAYGFSEGLASVKLNDKYGYINTKGDFEISPQFYFAGYFNNGRAHVNKNSLDYLINSSGEIITEGSTDMQMLNDQYFAYKKGGLYGIKDLSGNILKAPFMSDFWGFSEGLAGVKIQGKWGFMDENFKIVITPKYTEKIVYAFHNGYARFKQNGKVGLIDKTGKVILEAAYAELYEYSDGLLAYSEGGKWGYLDITGKVVIPAQFFSAENFENGVAKVKTGPVNCNLIDKNNVRIISDVYDLHIFSNNIIGVNAKGGWGLVELNK